MKTAIEKMYDELKVYSRKESIHVKGLADKVGCSVAHVSQTLKMAEHVGILKRDIEGNLFKKEFPKKRTAFVILINDESRVYRATTKGTGSPRNGKGSRVPPSDFEINEDTIIGVIQKVMADNRSLKEKNVKLIKYAKKLKARLEKEQNADFHLEDSVD